MTGMKKTSEEYIAVNDLLRTGDTVGVKIVKADPVSERIELQLVRGPERRSRRW